MWFFCLALVAACWYGPPLALAAVWAVPPAVAGLLLKRRWPPVAAASLAAAGFLFGAGALHTGLQRRLPAVVAGHSRTLIGRVTGLPQRQVLPGGRQRLRFMLYQPRTDRHLRLSLYDPQARVYAGERVRVRAHLSPPRALVNRDGFDRARADLAAGIDGLGYVTALHRLHGGRSGMDRLRARISARLRRRVSWSPRAAAMLPALVTGDRRGIDAADWRLLRHNGVAHLFAISGLHIALVSGLVWFLMRWLPVTLLLPPRLHGRVSQQQAAVVPALLAATGYAALAGFSLPTQRSLCMTAIVFAGLLLRLRPARSSVLGCALLAVLLWQPLACLGTGFWLSFLAVALLVFILGGEGASLWRSQWVLALGLGALGGWLFHDWSPAAPLANLVLVPVFSLLLVPLTLVAALVPGIPMVPDMAARLLDGCLDFLSVLQHGAPAIPVPTDMVAVAGIALAAILVGTRWLPLPRWLVPFLLLPWLWPSVSRPAVGDFDLVSFDVGQGLAMAVRTHDGLVLFDTGPDWPGGNTGTRLLAPWLHAAGLPLRLVFVSHGDSDHVGGLKGIRALIPPGRLFSGEPSRVPGSHPCLRGQRWRLDGVGLRVLWPPKGVHPRSHNNHSCVVRVQGAHGSALLTGDIEKPVEYWLVRHGLKPAGVLQVPHHGSKSSSSYSLLHRLRPGEAMASAGWHNRFGHPAGSVVSRYRRLKIPLYVTAREGMIVFRMDGQHNASPVCWRRRHTRPWRAQPRGALW